MFPSLRWFANVSLYTVFVVEEGELRSKAGRGILVKMTENGMDPSTITGRKMQRTIP